MFRIATCILIAIAALGSPWLLGGSSTWCYALAPVVVLIAAFMWLCTPTDSRLSGWSLSAIVVMTILLSYVWLQSIPLPQPLMSVLTSTKRLDRIDYVAKVESDCDSQLQPSPIGRWNRISADPPETRRQWAILATAIAISLIAAFLASDELCRLFMVFLLAFNGAAFGVLALFQRASAPGMIYWTIKPKQGVPFGAFVNTNHAGLFLALSGLCALFGICLLISQRIVKRSASFEDSDPPSFGRAVSLTDLRMIWLSQRDSVLFSLAFCALFCAVSSIVAASRSGALAFAAVVVVATIMLFMSGADRRLILVIGVLGGIAAIFSGVKFRTLADRLGAPALESGWSTRWQHWSDVLSNYSEFALTGVGHGGYAYSTLPYVSKPTMNWCQHADNQFVETFVELGGLGSLIVILIVVFFGMRVVSLIRETNLQSRIVGLFGAGLLAICGINAMGDFALAMPGVLLPVSLAAGFVLGYRPKREKVSIETSRSRLFAAALKLAVVGILLVAAGIGMSHLSNSRLEVNRKSDPAQWIARTIAKKTGESSPSSFTNDADAAVNRFLEATRAAVNRVDAEALSEELYTLENLAMLEQAADIDESDPVIGAIHAQMGAKEGLASAHRDYQLALNRAPMRFQNHIALAKLDLLLCPGQSVKARVEQVRAINPTSGIDASKTGIISVINGDFGEGGALLAQALREVPQIDTEVFNVLRSQMTVKEVAKYVLKQDAKLIILAADRFYAAKEDWTERSFLYAQLRQAIESGMVTGLTEAEAKFYLAKSKRMSGDIDGAIADFEAACEDWQTPLEWRKELAYFYEDLGRLREAVKVLKRINQELAYDPSVEKRIEQLEKVIRESRRLHSEK